MLSVEPIWWELAATIAALVLFAALLETPVGDWIYDRTVMASAWIWLPPYKFQWLVSGSRERVAHERTVLSIGDHCVSLELGFRRHPKVAGGDDAEQ